MHTKQAAGPSPFTCTRQTRDGWAAAAPQGLPQRSSGEFRDLVVRREHASMAALQDLCPLSVPLLPTA